MKINWILPLIVSGGCYGLADTLCDIVIHQEEDDKKDGKTIHYEELQNISISTDVSQLGAEPKQKKSKETQHLTGIQTIFICTVVTYVLVAIFFTWIMWTHETYRDTAKGKSFLFPEKYKKRMRSFSMLY